MREKKLSNDGLMTEGSIGKQLIGFAFPLLLGNLFQQLYNTVDAVIVGKFVGSEALAAVNSSTPLVNLLVSFFMGISVGAGVVISQYYGAKNDKKLHDAVHTTVALALASGIFMTFVGIVLSPIILRLMGTPEDVMGLSTIYLQIYFGGILGIVVYNMCSGILRAVGDSKRPLYFLMVSSVINIILDLLFVAIFDMGVAGVAFATLIAQFVSAGLTLFVLVRTSNSFKLILRDIRFHKLQIIKIVRIGLPTGIQNTIVSLSNVVVQGNINSFGTLAMAGSYAKIDGFAILPVMSIAMAITTFTGQNIGAKKYDRVKEGTKIGTIFSLITVVIISAIIMIFTPNILKIFTNDSDVIYYGTLMMKCLAPGYIFLGLSHLFSGVLRGAGKTTVPMIIMVLCWCFLRMAWVLTFTPIFKDIKIVFFGYPITWFASAAILLIYYKKANWLPHEEIIEEKTTLEKSC